MTAAQHTSQASPWTSLVLVLAVLILQIPLIASSAAEDPALTATITASAAKAQAWILAQQQPNGAFLKGHQFAFGTTAIVVNALLTPPLALDSKDPHLVKALAYLNGFRQSNGGYFDPAEGLGDYGTSLMLLILSKTHGADKATIVAAQNYLFGIQNVDPKDPARGGLGYGDDSPGSENLVTTSFAVRALRATGVPPSDPHLKAAMAFLERCQNLSPGQKAAIAKSTGQNLANITGPARSTGDGGAAYSPKEDHVGSGGNAEDVKNEKGQTASGALSSYGGVTYALISSYLALDLKPNDPRVVAALAWCKSHYQFDGNPGMLPDSKNEGLMYYYAMMARTMSMLNLATVTLADGHEADWRSDLFKAIQSRSIAVPVGADPTGGLKWTNSATRWGEGMPAVATSYMLMALKQLEALP